MATARKPVELTVEQVKATAKPKRRRPTAAQFLAHFLQPLPQPTVGHFERQRELFEVHDPAVWTIRLPLPPTVNNYRAVVRGRLITTAEGRTYHKAIEQLWRAHWKGWPPEPLTGPVRMLIGVAYHNHTKIDLDNRVKPLQDALVTAGAFSDDSQIDDLRVIRLPLVARPGWVDVTIETI